MSILAQDTQAEIGVLSRKQEEPSASNQGYYTANVIRTVAHFAELASQWDALLDASGEFNLCLRHEWLMLWLNTFPPNELLTIVVQDEQGRFMAVAPFLISRNESGLFCRALRRLQFIGTAPEVYDWMKIALHPEADAESVFRLLGEQLIRHRTCWDVVDLRYLKSQEQLRSLQRLIGPIAGKLQISQPMSIPYIDLPEDWELYPAMLRKKKYRNDFKRIQNHIRNDFKISAARLTVHQPSDASDQRLASFLHFHREYWLARGSRTEYGRSPRLLEFYQTAYRQFSAKPGAGRPVFEFSTLELGGKPVSYHFDIQSPQGCMGYLSCYDQQARKYRPGILHIEALIARTHQLGGRRFEFGRGDEHYKNQWHIEKVPLWNLLAFRTPLSQALWRLDEKLKQLKARLMNGTMTHGPDDPSTPCPDQPAD